MMVFSNLVFLFAFLPVVLLFYTIPWKPFKNVWLLIASLFFYAWGEPVYIFLMLGSIGFNYVFGLAIAAFSFRRRVWLTLAVVFNLFVLGFFKYAAFLFDNINRFFGTSIEGTGLPLPIGISFFTFQAMSYVIDVYRKKVAAQRNPLSLALYISFFPQLIAGPIVRYYDINEQLKERSVTLDKFTYGTKRFLTGLGKKVLLANSFAVIADDVFSRPLDEVSVLSAWIGILAYSLQIYFDFSGYSDMAIGLGKMFGFDFMENFRYPYIADSITDFWRRWHISLSSWFRDYVYIPLGGSRRGLGVTIRNLLIVWTITGFWHGASWTFLAWGFYYGLLITMEKLGGLRILDKLWKPFRHLYVLLIVMIGWVFFRADDFSYSVQYLLHMAGWSELGWVDDTSRVFLHDHWYLFVLGILMSLPLLDWARQRGSAFLDRRIVRYSSPLAVPAFYMFVLLASILQLVNSSYNPFIYFRF